jgi:hypothetical protein
MKKLAVLALIVFLGLNTSLAKTMSVEREAVSPKHSGLKTRMPTKNVLVHAIPRTQRRLLITNNLIDDENDDPPGPDELDLQSPYTRPRIVKNKDHNDDDLSEYVTVRLAVARARAMAAYRNKNNQTV